MEGLNWIDYVILVVLFLSVIAGLLRGFVKEVISLVTWVLAFLISMAFSSKLATIFYNMTAAGAGHTHPPAVAIVIAFVVIFIGVLVVGSVIGYMITRMVEVDGISIANRLLGGLFGIARGAFIVMVAILLLELTVMAQQDVWKQSKLILFFEPAVASLNNIVDPWLGELKDQLHRDMQRDQVVPTKQQPDGVIPATKPEMKVTS